MENPRLCDVNFDIMKRNRAGGHILSDFFVVTIISNPCRYKRRYELYWKFKSMCEAAGVNLLTVEQAFGDRAFEITHASNPWHLQIRTHEELWHKENMINLGIAQGVKLNPDFKRVAWVDADCRPARMPKEWFEETWHALQHYEFVQMWETMVDLDYEHNIYKEVMESFMATYIKYGCPTPEEFEKLKKEKGHHHHHHKHAHHPYRHHKFRHHRHHQHKHHSKQVQYDGGSNVFGRPGLAWAANIDALNKVGGLIDFSILGAGDWYMAHGLIGSMYVTSGDWATNEYGKKLLAWQDLAERWIKRDVGYVPGMVMHDSHGTKIDREYGIRGQILTSNGYNPNVDIKKDAHGLWQLESWEPRQLKLRDQIRGYFRRRNEDSTEL